MEHDTLSDLLQAHWLLYDQVEQFISGEESKEQMPDFSSFAESLAEKPADEFRESVDKANISQLASLIRVCELCPLSQTRLNAVPGMGVINAKVMIIGEGPGEWEDKSGVPFVGRAGKFLDAWLQSISLSRDENVFITNIVKCRPPGNRNPKPEEEAACEMYLDKQISLVKPEAILCLGKVAGNHILQRQGTLSSMRGTFHQYRSIPLVVTYHPAAVLRNMSLRRDVWNDLKMLAAFLKLPLVTKRGT
ncbi:MAG: uracil-DNA glycosylase [Sphaerochaetaceae bacterium]|nr:uracil-DNA glycosylase [Sphaerochaetaceae bacterium]